MNTCRMLQMVDLQNSLSPKPRCYTTNHSTSMYDKLTQTGRVRPSCFMMPVPFVTQSIIPPASMIHLLWLVVLVPPPSWCGWCCWWCLSPSAASRRTGPASLSKKKKRRRFKLDSEVPVLWIRIQIGFEFNNFVDPDLYSLIRIRIQTIQSSSVVDPNTLNLDPDPGLYYQLEKIQNHFREK